MANYSGPDKDMPVNQLFQPANLYGASNASAEAQFLKNEKVMQPCNDSFGHLLYQINDVFRCTTHMQLKWLVS